MHILFNFIWEASVAVIDLVWNFSGCAVLCSTVPLQALWAVLIRALWVSTMGLSTFHIAAMATLSLNVLLIEWHLIRPWNTTPKLTKRAREGKGPASQPTLGLAFRMWTATWFKVMPADVKRAKRIILLMWWFEASWNSCEECMLSNKRQILMCGDYSSSHKKKLHAQFMKEVSLLEINTLYAPASTNINRNRSLCHLRMEML